MAYAKYKSNIDVGIEDKHKGYAIPKVINDKNKCFSIVEISNNTITTAGTTSAQQATTNQAPRQHAENVRSGAHSNDMLSDLTDKEDTSSHIKKKCKSKLKYFVLLVAMIVIAATSSSVTAVIHKKNLEDSLKHVREEGIWYPWSNWGKCSVTCNVGVRSRNRTCYGTGPDVLQGICSGNDVDISICNNNKDCTQEPGPSDVSFSSYLKTSLTNVKAGTTVVFDGVINNAGDAYSTSTGIFTCPTAGTYLFSLTVHNRKGKKSLNVYILIDGVRKTYAISEPAFDSHDSTGTTTLVTQLNIGQRVWTETSYKKDNTNIFRTSTQFVGVLIHR